MTSTGTPAESKPAPPAARGGSRQWQDRLIRYQHLLIAGISALGLVGIWSILRPPAAPAPGTMKIDGIEGDPLPPPMQERRGRQGMSVGDVVVIQGEKLELSYSDPTGRNSTAPALIDRADRRRADAVLLLRVQPILRERMGITDEDMQRIEESTRGLALNVSEADRAAIKAAMDAGDMDRARLLVARAANAAREDFVDRTERAVKVLREVLPDERLEMMKR